MTTSNAPLNVSLAPDGSTTSITNMDSITTTESLLTDAEIVKKLALMKPMDYDRARKLEAKNMGIQVKTLDEMVRAARNDVSSNDRLPFPEVTPYPDPIDPALLLDELVRVILRYIVMDIEQAEAAALWIVFTWFIDDVDIAPIAIINAPEKACGKSQLLTIFGYLCARPLPAANSTASFLFRAIGAWRPTILIDEADTFIRENEELKGLVNAGHTRENAYVGRTVAIGDGHEPKLFEVWSAKAFAGIALERHLPDATMSRGIVINLRRKMPHESVERLRHADRIMFTELSSKLARFCEDYSQQVCSARPTLPEDLSDRAQDNWEPLLSIAQCAGKEWVERATKAALTLSQSEHASVSTGNELLADIQVAFEQKRTRKITTIELIEALTNDPENSWATYNRGKPLTPRQLGKQLAAYGIKSKTVRMGNSTPKGYDLEDFTDAFSRYLAPSEKLPQQRNEIPEIDPTNLENHDGDLNSLLLSFQTSTHEDSYVEKKIEPNGEIF